jgi:predicted transcriptional regulator
MKTGSLRNFHLPLSDELYSKLRGEAQLAGQSATSLARQAIEAWLEHRRKSALHEAIAGYAAAKAGTSEDLDDDLEAAALERWT